MPRIEYYQNGVLLKTEDTRTREEVCAERNSIIRAQCSEIILKAGIDTATQQNAALGIYEPARCEAIKNYIAACRNEYLRCKALILAATSNEMADSVTFIAPTNLEGL